MPCPFCFCPRCTPAKKNKKTNSGDNHSTRRFAECVHSHLASAVASVNVRRIHRTLCFDVADAQPPQSLKSLNVDHVVAAHYSACQPRVLAVMWRPSDTSHTPAYPSKSGTRSALPVYTGHPAGQCIVPHREKIRQKPSWNSLRNIHTELEA